MSELRKEFKNLLSDYDKNIQNKQDLEYAKNRAMDFMNVVIDEVEKILDFKQDKITQIEKLQNELDNKLNSMQKDIQEIEEDIYIADEEAYDELYDEDLEESDYDFEIVCPYCDTEFLVDLNQNAKELECPACNNLIELEWSGNEDDM